eukprot:2049898-Alexandrium_andersonii.AAC.1
MRPPQADARRDGPESSGAVAGGRSTGRPSGSGGRDTDRSADQVHEAQGEQARGRAAKRANPKAANRGVRLSSGSTDRDSLEGRGYKHRKNEMVFDHVSGKMKRVVDLTAAQLADAAIVDAGARARASDRSRSDRDASPATGGSSRQDARAAEATRGKSGR